MQAAQGYPEPVLELRDLLNTYLDRMFGEDATTTESPHG